MPPLQHITVSAREGERADWHLPGYEYFYNVRKDENGQRKFVRLDDWMQTHPKDTKLKAAADSVREHLMGTTNHAGGLRNAPGGDV